MKRVRTTILFGIIGVALGLTIGLATAFVQTQHAEVRAHVKATCDASRRVESRELEQYCGMLLDKHELYFECVERNKSANNKCWVEGR